MTNEGQPKMGRRLIVEWTKLGSVVVQWGGVFDADRGVLANPSDYELSKRLPADVRQELMDRCEALLEALRAGF